LIRVKVLWKGKFGDPCSCPDFFARDDGLFGIEMAELTQSGSIFQVVPTVFPKPTLQNVMRILARTSTHNTEMIVPLEDSLSKVRSSE
jgi:hypothetical protein